MSKTEAIARRLAAPSEPASPAHHVVTALSASELLETLRELLPDLRDEADDPAEGDLTIRDAVVISCGATTRRTVPARYGRTPAASASEPLSERFGLSDRQAEVARLLAAGHSNAEIGEALGLSTYTARNHAARVLHKLGIRRRSGVGLALMTDEPPAESPAL